MSKIKIALSCPIDTYSGYGARSRDIVKALLKTEKYDIEILSQRWGNTRFGYLKDHGEDLLYSLIVPGLSQKPDVWFQITIPNEFQPVGKYNIGVTAGIETNLCHHEWIEGGNRMDLILASSEHTKQVLVDTVYELEQNSQNVGTIKLKTPVEVLFEGVDLEKYFPTTLDESSTVKQTLDSIEESFAFLFVGHWLQGDFNQDRKNVGLLIKAFLEVFKNKKKAPALILKTQHANSSILDRDQILKKINSIRNTVKGKLPNIYLIHGELADEEVNELYSHTKVKAMINLTKGEGFGRPLLEFSVHNKPIIASNWSGQTDFLHKDYTFLVDGELENVHKSAAVKNMLLTEAKWFTASSSHAGIGMREVFEKYKEYQEKAKRQGYHARTNFSWEAMADKLDNILTERLPEFPKQVPFSLPKLELPKLQKLG